MNIPRWYAKRRIVFNDYDRRETANGRDTNYERSDDETSSALITRTIVRSSGNRTFARVPRMWNEASDPRDSCTWPRATQRRKSLADEETNGFNCIRRSFACKPVDACFWNLFTPFVRVSKWFPFFFSFTNLLAIEKNNVKASVLVFYRL